MEKDEQETGISLMQFFALAKKNIVLLLVCTLIAMGGTFFVTKYIIQKTYVSTVKLYVSTSNESNANDPQMNVSALDYAQKVVNTYIEMLRTNTFYQKISTAIGSKYSVAQLSNMITFSTLNETEVFQAQISAHNPQDAKQIADLIAGLSPETISSFKEGASLKVVDPPTFSDQPSSPKVTLCTVIGALLGLFAACVFIVLRDQLDVRIKNEDDIMENYDIPLLATIPFVDTDSGKKSKNYKVVRS